MSEPTREYGWITAITPEEIRAMGRPQHGDFLWIGSKWEHMEVHRALTHYEPIDITRRPINPGEGWEIVPLDGFVDCKCEYYNPLVNQWCRIVADRTWQESVTKMLTESKLFLAFRRPIVAKEMQTGQLEAELKLEIQQRGNVLAMEELARQATEAEQERDKLRTLTAAQSKALEAAEEALKNDLETLKRLRMCENEFYIEVPSSIEEVESALTLIQQAKEIK